MVSMMNLIKYILLITVFFCCQYQATFIQDDNGEISDFDIDDNHHIVYPNDQDRAYHQLFQRASLRYHPHVLYKKASLKPLIGRNGKISQKKRTDQ